MTHAGWQVALYLFASLLSLAQLASPRLSGEAYLASREAHVVHVVMNLVMAAMVSAAWTPQGRTVAIGALGVTAIVLAIRCVRPHGGDANRRAGSLYHLLAVAAMLYASRLMPAMMPAHGTAMHGMAMPMAQPGGLLPTILGGLFAADAVVTIVLVVAMPRTLLRMEAELSGWAAEHGAIGILRLSAVPHVIMDVGMALMLL